MGNEAKDSILNGYRNKFDVMTERIVSKLKERSRFPQNRSIYIPDAGPIKGREGASFFEYAVEGLEKYHAKLGRFDHEDQTPIMLDNKQEIESVDFYTKVEQEMKQPFLNKVSLDIKVNSDILDFYPKFAVKLGMAGEDKTTFGETAYCDADIVEIVNERINLGKFIAESKLKGDALMLWRADEKTLLEKIRNPGREHEIIENVKKLSDRYQLDKDLAEEFFKWIIDETLKVELDYLSKIKKG